ncbi:hypothetical protein [Streptomyces sp. NPDC046727]|uniref:tetratricopeptide repeat protein n=1 Tax=Streptomyces sp. NPDC046727 TaxID=3155373 RepID=UPI0033C38E3D
MAQQGVLPYLRKENGEFGEPRVLDVVGLRDAWLPWISLQDHPTASYLGRNAVKAWERTRRTDPGDLLARPWLSTIAAGGLRKFVLAQARTPDLLARADGPFPPPLREFRDVWQEWLTGDDPLRRLQATSILGALTATLPVARTEDPDLADGDLIHQHYCFERAKVLRIRDPEDAHAEALLEEVARRAAEPVIRTMATINVLWYMLRFGIRQDTMPSWVEYGVAQLPALHAEHPVWLSQVIASRFHRLKALFHVRQGDDTAVLAALEEATTADEEARADAQADPDSAYVWAEGHGLLLNAKMRYQTRRKGDPDEIADIVAELERTDPNSSTQRYAIGDLYAAAGRLPEAADHFERTAQIGTVLGATAAFQAYQCHAETGDTEGAHRSLLLLADLDPSADVDHYARTVG